MSKVMWKKVEKDLRGKSLVKNQASKSETQLKANLESIVNCTIMVEDIKGEQQKRNQKQAHLRSHLQISMLNTVVQLQKPEDQDQSNKLQFNSETKLPQKKDSQNCTNENPNFVNKIKQQIESVLDAVHNVKLQQQSMKSDYENQAMKFQQLMHKVLRAFPQKKSQNVNQALVQIKNYREKLSKYEQRSQKILKDYGLSLNQLI